MNSNGVIRIESTQNINTLVIIGVLVVCFLPVLQIALGSIYLRIGHPWARITKSFKHVQIGSGQSLEERKQTLMSCAAGPVTKQRKCGLVAIIIMVLAVITSGAIMILVSGKKSSLHYFLCAP